jgi:hypothetical protein
MQVYPFNFSFLVRSSFWQGDPVEEALVLIGHWKEELSLKLALQHFLRALAEDRRLSGASKLPPSAICQIANLAAA